MNEKAKFYEAVRAAQDEIRAARMGVSVEMLRALDKAAERLARGERPPNERRYADTGEAPPLTEIDGIDVLTAEGAASILNVSAADLDAALRVVGTE